MSFEKRKKEAAYPMGKYDHCPKEKSIIRDK
jgi:hypothetical protein